MQATSVLRMALIALTGLATIGQPDAWADKVKVAEIYGTGLRAASVKRVSAPISDCGDTDATTNISSNESKGTVTYTGFMEGTGEVLSQGLADNCSGQNHNTFRVLDKFRSLAVEGRIGGAVVEIVGRGTSAGGVTLNESRLRILCGTGELKDVYAEGAVNGSAYTHGASSGFQVWAHFGHKPDFGFDFMCRDLEQDEKED